MLIRDSFRELTGKVECVAAGPSGGDIQIASEILHGKCHVIICLQDTQPQPHEPDVNILRRACQASTAPTVLLSDKQSVEEWICTEGDYDPILAVQLRNTYGPYGLKGALVVPDAAVREDLDRLQSLMAGFDTPWDL